MKILTIDIGGMSIKYTIFENDIKMFEVKKININESNRIEVLKIIKKIYLENKDSTDGIAISSPGGILKNNFIQGKNAIKNWTNFNVVDTIKEVLSFSGDIVVINDGNAAAYSDYASVEPSSTIITVAIGTGIGAGVIVNGELLNGKDGFSGEVGFISSYVNNENDLKNIKNGSFVGGFYFLEKRYFDLTGVKASGKDIFDFYDDGNVDAKTVVESMYWGLTILLFNISVTLNPDYIFIGGGLAKRKEFIEEITPYIAKTLERFNVDFDLIKLKLSQNGWESQLHGAYHYFKSKM